jgi:hypothetical protein
MKPVDQAGDALTDIELDLIVGGAASKAEAQIQQTLSSMISEVIKNFGSALQTAARAG